MRKKKSVDEYRSFEHVPFSRLIELDQTLAGLRAEYASQPPEVRRKAADWAYYSDCAAELFDEALGRAGRERFVKPTFPSGYEALAIEPGFAPALLTVGSIEYQLRRVDEAMRLFMTLTSLPGDEEDLPIIIDKAGDFLIDQGDIDHALELYLAAEAAFPNQADHCVGAGYCLGKLKKHTEAVEKHRKAVALEPDNSRHLNDLGYSLLEAGALDEAEEVLLKAVSLAPADYELPNGNLQEVLKQRRRAGGARSISFEGWPPQE